MTITEKIEKMEGRLSSEPMILKLSKLKGIYFFEQLKKDNPKFVAKVKEPINVDTFNKNMFRYDSFLKLEIADDSHLATKNMRVAHAFANYVQKKLGISGEVWSTDRTKSRDNSIVSLHIMDDKLPIGISLFLAINKDFKVQVMESSSLDKLLSPSGTLITNDYDDMTELKFIGGGAMEKVVRKKILSKKDIIEYANIIKKSRINGDRKPIQCWQSLQKALLEYDNVYVSEVDDDGIGKISIRYKNGTWVQLDDIIPSDFYFNKESKFLK